MTSPICWEISPKHGIEARFWVNLPHNHQEFSQKPLKCGIEADVYSWRGKTGDTESESAQIDMLIDRADGVIDICEIKYSDNPYEMGKEENAKIIRRIETFRKATGVRKAIRSVLISASGLKPGKYSGNIMAVVSEEDLFTEITE